MSNTPGGQGPTTPAGPQGVIDILKALLRRILESIIVTVQSLLALAKANVVLTIIFTAILISLTVALSQCGGPSNNTAATSSTEVTTTVESTTTVSSETTVVDTTTSSTVLSVVPSGSVVQLQPTTEKKVATTTTVAKKKTTTTLAPTTTEATTTTVAPSTTPPPTTTTTLPPTTTTTTPARSVAFDFQGDWSTSPWYKTNTITNVTPITGIGNDSWAGTLPAGNSNFSFSMYLYKNPYGHYEVATRYAISSSNATCVDETIRSRGVTGNVRPFYIPPDDYLRVTCTATGSGPITVAVSYPPPPP